jgi:hypothetical protein
MEMSTASGTDSIKADHNALGKAAFIVGLIGLVLSFVPIIGFVSWLLAPLAILFGLIALRRPSRSLAIAGIIAGAIGLLVCVSWIRATRSFSEAMSADTFNNTGRAVDNSSAPIVTASIRGVWEEMAANKIAAGRKYGNRRLSFRNEVIDNFEGDAANPRITFVGATDNYIVHLVTASFTASEGDRIAALRRGARVSFVCQNIRETFGDGYSLAGCTLS